MREFLHQVGRKLRERALLHEEDELLSDLSFGLRAKLALSINKHYLTQMPFFAAAEEGFVSEVGMRMRSCYYSVGEEVGRISRAARASASAARPPECARLRIFVCARASSLASRAALPGCAGRARG